MRKKIRKMRVENRKSKANFIFSLFCNSAITQKEFAQKLNLSRETIRRYEKGITKPDKKTVEKMAKILKVSVRSLVNGKGGKKK